MLDNDLRFDLDIVALGEEFDAVAQLVTAMSLPQVEAYIASTAQADVERDSDDEPLSTAIWVSGVHVAETLNHVMVVDMDQANTAAWNEVWSTPDRTLRTIKGVSSLYFNWANYHSGVCSLSGTVNTPSAADLLSCAAKRIGKVSHLYSGGAVRALLRANESCFLFGSVDGGPLDRDRKFKASCDEGAHHHIDDDASMSCIQVPAYMRGDDEPLPLDKLPKRHA